MPKAKTRNSAATTAPKVRWVTIRVPVVAVDDGYLPSHMNFTLLGHRGGLHMRAALRGMNEALNQTHAQFSNGRHVDDNASTVRWLLEQVAEAVDADVVESTD